MLSNGEKKLFELINNDMLKEFAYLFQNGVSINKFAENQAGQSLLGSAIEKKAYGIVQYLIDVPGLISQRDRHGRTPLMYLSRHFDHKMINILKLKGVDLNQDVGLGRNLLHLAATKKDHRIFDMLVSIGLDKNKVCSRGETPIDTLNRYSSKEPEIAKISNQ